MGPPHSTAVDSVAGRLSFPPTAVTDLTHWHLPHDFVSQGAQPRPEAHVSPVSGPEIMLAETSNKVSGT